MHNYKNKTATFDQPNPAAFILFFMTNVKSQEDFVLLILFTGHMTFFFFGILRGKLLLARNQASGGNCPLNNEKIKEIKIFRSAGLISAVMFIDRLHQNSLPDILTFVHFDKYVNSSFLSFILLIYTSPSAALFP